MEHITGSNFKRLIGECRTSGSIYAGKDTLTLSGTDSYKFVLGNHYILHQADVSLGDHTSKTLELIKLDDIAHRATMHYFNSQGEDGQMLSTFFDNTLIINGTGLRFEGEMNREDTRLRGTWFKQSGDDRWIAYIDLVLEKR
jgi:hypothetical protein